MLSFFSKTISCEITQKSYVDPQFLEEKTATRESHTNYVIFHVKSQVKVPHGNKYVQTEDERCGKLHGLETRMNARKSGDFSCDSNKIYVNF